MITSYSPYSRSPYSIGGNRRSFSAGYGRRAYSFIPYSRDPVNGVRIPVTYVEVITASLQLSPTILVHLTPAAIEADLTLTGSLLSKQYIPLDQLDVSQISVSKGVTDDIWAMNATIDGYQVLNTDVLRHATFSTTDHLGVSQAIFAGILPKGSYTIKEAANKTMITGYDYAWYLSRQKVQSAYQHNTATTNPTIACANKGANATVAADYMYEMEFIDPKPGYVDWGTEEEYYAAPDASFTCNITGSLPITKMAGFTDTSTLAPTSWEWNFGDGTSNVTTQNATHKYTKRGRWTVIMTATNTAGSDSASQAIRVIGG